MPASLKNFADLKQLGQQLKQQEEKRLRAEAERLKAEKQALLEANIYRTRVGSISPLNIAEKHLPSAPRPEPLPSQHLAHDRLALQASLPD